MTALDWILLVFSFTFIGVLVWAADEIENTGDEDDYNNEAGVQEDK